MSYQHLTSVNILCINKVKRNAEGTDKCRRVSLFTLLKWCTCFLVEAEPIFKSEKRKQKAEIRKLARSTAQQYFIFLIF